MLSGKCLVGLGSSGALALRDFKALGFGALGLGDFEALGLWGASFKSLNPYIAAVFLKLFSMASRKIKNNGNRLDQ